MRVPPVIQDAIRLLLVAVLEHQFVVLFFVVAIEEAGVPLPAPTDVVIAFYGFRARGDLPELAQVVLVCALASTVGTLVPYFLARRFGPTVAHRLATWIDIDPARVDRWTERIHRRGFIAVVVGRLVPGARVIMSLIAGTARVPVYQFSPAVFVAALALVFLVGGRREPVTLAADAIVFVGLAGHADPLWVAVLIVASLASRDHDPRAILIVVFASIAATFVYVDWTILTGLLAVIATVRAGLGMRRVLRAV